MTTLKEKLKPAFCTITPTAYLYQYAAQSSRHLVLAHLVDTDSAYATFYREGVCDDYIIMDNGAFELGESYAPDKLIDLAKKCSANAIVLPDYPGQEPMKTIDASAAMVSKVKDAGFDTFFCPQGRVGFWYDWLKGYNWAAENDEIDIIGMSILAIPNALPHLPPAYARVVATELLQKEGNFAGWKYHHYLGLNAGPALEIPSLLKMQALDSIDSSGPVLAGILGHRYSRDCDSFQHVKKLRIPVDFSMPLTDDKLTHERIQHNLDLTFSLFYDETEELAWSPKEK